MQLSRSQFQGHPFHLVTPSPWPLLTSFSLLTLTISAAMYFNGFANGGILVALGFVATVSAMILWFRDVVAEGTLLGNHTFAVQKGLNLGVALFIVSEIFFFISIFWRYFHSALAPTVELGMSWPPQGIDPLNPLTEGIFKLSYMLGNYYNPVLYSRVTTWISLVNLQPRAQRLHA